MSRAEYLWTAARDNSRGVRVIALQRDTGRWGVAVGPRPALRDPSPPERTVIDGLVSWQQVVSAVVPVMWTELHGPFDGWWCHCIATGGALLSQREARCDRASGDREGDVRLLLSARDGGGFTVSETLHYVDPDAALRRALRHCGLGGGEL